MFDEFKLIFGLNIYLTKCKKVWIVLNMFFNINLFEKFGLVWSSTPMLLGINFDSDLALWTTTFTKNLRT